MGTVDGVHLSMWAQERYLKTMECVAAFNTLPMDTDQYLHEHEVHFVRRALETVLARASKQSYAFTSDQGSVAWAIWLSQDRHAVRRGAWEVHSLQLQVSLCFMGMCAFLEHQVSKSQHTTVDARCRDAQNLSELLVACDISPLHPEIVAQFAPKLVAS